MVAEGINVISFEDGEDLLARVIAGEARLLFDGGMGTMLQRRGLAGGELPELLCLSDPQAVTDIHRAYVEAGSQVITTNTFGANRLHLDGAATVDEVFSAAVVCARAADPRYVAADIGPLGVLLDPYGDLELDEAYELFAEQAKAASSAGADLIIIETMADLQEIEQAVRAVKDACDLPVFATMTFGQGGRTLFGASPNDAVELLEELGVDALGVNCSLGPIELSPIVAEMLACSTKPIIVQANAGLPRVSEGQTTYSIDVDQYVEAVARLIDDGVRVVGGCCGTDPDYIRGLAAKIRSVQG